MPFVWGEVTGMVHLLKLLPGVMLERRSRNGRYSDSNELTEELVIHLSQSSSLGRLRLYAPFVRTLEVLELPHRFYKIEGDLSALHSTIPKSGLLPNLRYLTLTDTCETVNQDHVDWISLFLCRTLQSVRVLSWYPSKRLWLPLDQSPSALSELMQKCPNLEVLEVSPRSTISQREPGVYIPSEGSRESRRLGSPQSLIGAPRLVVHTSKPSVNSPAARRFYSQGISSYTISMLA
ncbi:hypothetical protein FRC12_006357 [Ceratobasidium sp. 428]|nr:hypothetical protein FRC12_006357 [Ceratobasidium sp. 428]